MKTITSLKDLLDFMGVYARLNFVDKQRALYIVALVLNDLNLRANLDWLRPMFRNVCDRFSIDDNRNVYAIDGFGDIAQIDFSDLAKWLPREVED